MQNLNKFLPTLGFEEIETNYEYSNNKFTIFIENSNTISILAEMDDEESGYLSIPSLKITSNIFLVKVLKAIGVL